MDLKSKIRVIEDFPKEGISFKDITTLVGDGEEYSNISKKLEELNLKENVFLTGYLSQDKIEKLMMFMGLNQGKYLNS